MVRDGCWDHLCRLSGRGAEFSLEGARKLGIPTLSMVEELADLWT
jgi:hypothetical protein